MPQKSRLNICYRSRGIHSIPSTSLLSVCTWDVISWHMFTV